MDGPGPASVSAAYLIGLIGYHTDRLEDILEAINAIQRRALVFDDS